MKKAAVIAAAAALLLTGCSTTSAKTVDSVEQSYQEQDFAAPSMSAEDKYLRDVHAQNNYYLEDETDADLLMVGYETCGVLEAGYTVEEMVTYLVMEGNPTDAEIEYQSIIIGNALEYLCPEYLDQV